MNSPKKNSKSVLHSQNRTDFLLKHKIFFMTLGFIAFCLVLFYRNQKRVYLSFQSGWVHFSTQTLGPSLSRSHPLIRILYPHDSFHSPELAVIAGILESSINIQDEDFIQKALKIAYNFGIIEQISAKKTGLEEYILAITPKIPILCVQMDTLRLVSGRGQIYGTVQDRTKCPNGIINGIFEPKEVGQLRLKPDRSIVLSSESASQIMESIELMNVLQNSKLQFSRDIFLEKSRGFTFHLASPPIEIIFGRSPFSTKLSRLNRILSNKQGPTIERIELDYKEKAFIKYAKPST